jgi:hypothetical protein
MLTKEEKMRRVLYVSVVLAMLLGTVGVAWAEEPEQGPIIVGDYDADLLGDVWTYYYGGFFPGERVDVYLYRPATAYWNAGTQAWEAQGWPLAEGPYWGTWWWGSDADAAVNMYMPAPEEPEYYQYNDSAYRRMNLTNEDAVFLYADTFGWYYAEFMHSRDEVWYPCSFPLKWKCNYWADASTYVYHSPAVMAYECIGPLCLDWPWTAPYDTVGPLEAHTFGELYWYGSPWYIEPYEVLGYYWKFEDLN